MRSMWYLAGLDRILLIPARTVTGLSSVLKGLQGAGDYVVAEVCELMNLIRTNNRGLHWSCKRLWVKPPASVLRSKTMPRPNENLERYANARPPLFCSCCERQPAGAYSAIAEPKAAPIPSAHIFSL